MNHTALRGVNLGGWLVLEKWLTPSVFASASDTDEYSLCRNGDVDTRRTIAKHRKSFIQRQDFAWLAQQGIRAVRIPVGYWIFGDAKPYMGGIEYLDKAFQWAEQYNIVILICLHGAPGSQNGEMHSGKQGRVEWGRHPQSIQITLKCIALLAQRYAKSPALWGIELLNEPAASISHRQLSRYYREAYHIVRANCDPSVRVVINDIYAPKRWRWALHWPFYTNVWFDSHQYQVFSQREKVMNIAEHVTYTHGVIKRLLHTLRRHHRLIIGEWSAALDASSLVGLSTRDKQSAIKLYYQAQIELYDTCDGWFYWTYKTENSIPWSFRSMQRQLNGETKL